ncbi:hypothetical protein E5329_28645 [Petralouisia muris]|uniref:Uncharacterized protein n=1 Tax=Petralouisia muris TaxID=3032872 RepID=A0AC61RKW0_9FIRM|nr:tyrosine-type recombinase/integrase [Petralouisia muris]TGY85879.1 hypothetical protein E5329_28645 [Petralouisia muris]
MSRYEFQSVFKEYIPDYISLRKASKSGPTVAIDRHYLEMFDNYLYTVQAGQDMVTEGLFHSWIQSLPFSRRTAACAVSSVRMFMKYLRGCGLDVFIPDIPKFTESYIPYLFSGDDIQQIFRLADSGAFAGRNRFLKAEFPMLLRLLLGCGLRIGETLSMKAGDIDFEKGVIIMKHTKRDRQRFVPMHPELTGILERYCIAMEIIGIPDAWVFPGMDNSRRLRECNVDVWFRKMADIAGLPVPTVKGQRGPCLHCFRHLFVANSFKNLTSAGLCADDVFPYLSTYLGHESLAETEKYMKFPSEMFQDELDRFGEYTSGLFPEVDYEE